MAFRSLLDGFLRNGNGVRPGCTGHAHTHELVRFQGAFRVVDTGANHIGSGRRIVIRSRENELARVRENRSVRQDDFNREIVICRDDQLACLNLFLQFEQAVFRNGEIHPHRRHLVYGCKLVVRSVDIRPFCDTGGTGQSVNGGFDRRVRQVQSGGVQLCLCLMHGSLCRQELSFGVIEVFFREGIQGDERLDPVEIGFGCRMRSLAGIERGFRFIDLNLKRAGIDLKERLPVPDHRTFLIQPFLQETVDAGVDVYLTGTGRLGDIFQRHGNILGFDGQSRYTRFSRLRNFHFLAAAKNQQTSQSDCDSTRHYATIHHRFSIFVLIRKCQAATDHLEKTLT